MTQPHSPQTSQGLDKRNKIIKYHCKRTVNGKAILVTGRGGPWGCETSRLPNFLGNRLTDGGEVVSPTRRLPFTPRNIPGTRFS
jgi:hypothetical protein